MYKKLQKSTKSLQKCTTVYKSLPKSTIVYQSLHTSTKVYNSLHKSPMVYQKSTSFVEVDWSQNRVYRGRSVFKWPFCGLTGAKPCKKNADAQARTENHYTTTMFLKNPMYKKSSPLTNECTPWGGSGSPYT